MNHQSFWIFNMDWKTCKYLVSSDLKREISGNITLWKFFFTYLVKESFMVSVWFRLGTFFMSKKSAIYKPLYYIAKIGHRHIQHKTGIQLPIGTQVGEGLKFFHHDCIIIAQYAKIGKNVSIHQGVTIGRVFAGPYAGVPIIGDSVVIFAGAKLLGNISIGDGAVIGANAVVTRDVPANCVVAGIPARVISENSNKCFNKEWGEVFCHDYE